MKYIKYYLDIFIKNIFFHYTVYVTHFALYMYIYVTHFWICTYVYAMHTEVYKYKNTYKYHILWKKWSRIEARRGGLEMDKKVKKVSVHHAVSVTYTLSTC